MSYNSSSDRDSSNRNPEFDVTGRHVRMALDCQRAAFVETGRETMVLALEEALYLVLFASADA